VLAMCRSRSVDRLRSLGAEEVIDAGSTSFESIAKDVDVVLDTLGGEFE
jgi:NADPH:quinone reductase-like Zn-dependent oxidoreductase